MSSSLQLETDHDLQVPVTIHFFRKGVLPPVYVAVDFTSEPWQPVEMDFEPDQSSDTAQFRFSKSFPLVSPGEHQYKLRLGPGDESWTVDDDADMGMCLMRRYKLATVMPSTTRKGQIDCRRREYTTMYDRTRD